MPNPVSSYNGIVIDKVESMLGKLQDVWAEIGLTNAEQHQKMEQFEVRVYIVLYYFICVLHIIYHSFFTIFFNPKYL